MKPHISRFLVTGIVASIVVASAAAQESGESAADTDEPQHSEEEEILVEDTLPYLPESNTIAAKLPLPIAADAGQRRRRQRLLIEEQRGVVLGDALRERQRTQRADRQRRLRLLRRPRLRLDLQRHDPHRRCPRAGVELLSALQHRPRGGAQGTVELSLRRQSSGRHDQPGAKAAPAGRLRSRLGHRRQLFDARGCGRLERRQRGRVGGLSPRRPVSGVRRVPRRQAERGRGAQSLADLDARRAHSTQLQLRACWR